MTTKVRGGAMLVLALGWMLPLFWLVALPPPAWGQDTTPPNVVDVVVIPPIFDATSSDVTMRICVTAEDNLSGLQPDAINLETPAGGILFNEAMFYAVGALLDTACRDFTIPRFAPLGIYQLRVSLWDLAGNRTPFQLLSSLPVCGQLTTCVLENRSPVGLPDADGDTIPDDADNCPDDANAGQEDADLDLIGDTCDPFPNDRDNEQAKCEADLGMCQQQLVEQAQCEADLDTCQGDLLACRSQPLPDADGDGEMDATDHCPGTAAVDPVDEAGCSVTQFCAGIDVTTRTGARLCKKADWRNDEPTMRGRDADCFVDRVDRTNPMDDVCRPVPVTP